MEFFVAFCNFALAMWLGWRQQPVFAAYVYFAGIVFAATILMRHATNPLPLTF
jgi:hypothetical protein